MNENRINWAIELDAPNIGFFYIPLLDVHFDILMCIYETRHTQDSLLNE